MGARPPSWKLVSTSKMAGKRKRGGGGEGDGKGEQRNRRFPLPIIPRSLAIFRLLLFQREPLPLRRRESRKSNIVLAVKYACFAGYNALYDLYICLPAFLPKLVVKMTNFLFLFFPLQVKENGVCPDGRHECPGDNICCYVRATGEYNQCCPLGYTCCPRGLSCCRLPLR